MATRQQNERNYTQWQDLTDGGRRYWNDYPSSKSGWARYIKLVDQNERTLAIIQEIYNGSGKLVARHEKYPVDKGHKWLD